MYQYIIDRNCSTHTHTKSFVQVIFLFCSLKYILYPNSGVLNIFALYQTVFSLIFYFFLSSISFCSLLNNNHICIFLTLKPVFLNNFEIEKNSFMLMFSQNIIIIYADGFSNSQNTSINLKSFFL